MYIIRIFFRVIDNKFDLINDFWNMIINKKFDEIRMKEEILE